MSAVVIFRSVLSFSDQCFENCISKMEYMQYNILDEGGLRLACAAWNDDDQELPLMMTRNQEWSSGNTSIWHTDSLYCGSMVAWVKATELSLQAAVFGQLDVHFLTQGFNTLDSGCAA